MQNLPKEYLKRMKSILLDEYNEFLNSYNFPAKMALRINTLKSVNIDKLPFNLKKVPWCNDGYYFEEKGPGKHVYHEQGLYYIQEPSAMAVVEELDVKNGDLVLDLCAAPGGKSTQIACKLNNSGYLVCNEIIPQRAKILSSNIERLGIKNAIVLNESADKLSNKFKSFFNKILVDAPCSGEGMFRKNEEAIFEWSEDNVKMCAVRQLEILNHAAKMCANGGRIVFSTCTFSDIENEKVILDFLKQNEDFAIIDTKNKFSNGIHNLPKAQRLYPHKIEGEGHFIAVLQKNGIYEQKNILTKKAIKQDASFVKFIKDNLNINLEYNANLKDNLYISPNLNLDNLKLVRLGLHLGQLKKGRFEPSHTLCMCLKKEHFKRTICFESDDERVKKYLRGEVFETSLCGWAAVIVDNNPLGWVKCDGVYAKNHYPKGLRKEL